MTRKHFIAVAKCVAKVSNRADRIVLAHDLAVEFAAANPHFDRVRFLVACNVPVPAPVAATVAA